jgi:hypothetical protein
MSLNRVQGLSLALALGKSKYQQPGAFSLQVQSVVAKRDQHLGDAAARDIAF